MGRLKGLLGYTIAGIAALIIIRIVFPAVHPTGGIRLAEDAVQTTSHAAAIMDSLGFPTAGMESSVELLQNQDLFRIMEDELGPVRTNELVSRGYPAYYWQVRWRQGSMSVVPKGNDKELEQEIATILHGEYSASLGPAGELIGFSRQIPDTISLPSVDSAAAIGMASVFLNRYSGYQQADTLKPSYLKFSSSQTILRPKRTDRIFTWTRDDTLLHRVITVTISLSGDRISAFKSEYLPGPGEKSSTFSTVQAVVLIGGYIGLIVILLIVAIRRLRKYEIGFKPAILLSVLTAVAGGFSIYIISAQVDGWQRWLQVALVALLYGGGLLILWAISESAIREKTADKLLTVDLIRNGYFLRSAIGGDIVRGWGLGMISVAVWLGAVAALPSVIPFRFTSFQDTQIQVFSRILPAIGIATHAFVTVIFMGTFLIFFAGTILRTPSRTGAWLSVVIPAILLGLHSFRSLRPEIPGLILEIGVSLIFSWCFFRYNVITTLAALMTSVIVPEIATLLGSGNPTYVSLGYLCAGAGGAIVIAGLLLQFRREETIDAAAIQPAYARIITERQRLQHEIEVARRVQISLLPSANPVSTHFDIASRCIPAQEVGGDYFDFITYTDGRLGIAIGDVSGKGTQAAFFMTLTKGFLRALVRVAQSPALILEHVNTLFYENVERGIFISMAYGIFDPSRSTFTIARAGHNPVIMFRPEGRELSIIQQTGLALGLNPNPLFAKTIQETEIRYRQGDVFVFYTDGFTEAMSTRKEEYGDDRFQAAVGRLADLSAETMLDQLVQDVRKFTGPADQHDDMTMVIVKIM